MLAELVLVFVLLAVAAWILGARGVAGFSMEVARVLVILFLLLAVVAWFAAA